jgi:hypothetical protein
LSSLVAPEKPVVIRLPHQKSPVADAIEMVLHTYHGLAFTRQTIVDNEDQVMALAGKITFTGGGGDWPFIVPDFTEEEAAAGLEKIKQYSLTRVKTARKLFGSPYEGVGDLDRLRNQKGYWSLTIYNMVDRYLIPNPKRKYSINSYEAKPNADGSYTLRINPEGDGKNAIPSAGADFYGIFRVYEPVPDLTFPPIRKVN